MLRTKKGGMMHGRMDICRYAQTCRIRNFTLTQIVASVNTPAESLNSATSTCPSRPGSGPRAGITSTRGWLAATPRMRSGPPSTLAVPCPSSRPGGTHMVAPGKRAAQSGRWYLHALRHRNDNQHATYSTTTAYMWLCCSRTAGGSDTVASSRPPTSALGMSSAL